jgi:hypothetical protein
MPPHANTESCHLRVRSDRKEGGFQLLNGLVWVFPIQLYGCARGSQNDDIVQSVKRSNIGRFHERLGAIRVSNTSQSNGRETP